MDWLIILASLLLPVVPLFFFPTCVCCPQATCGDACTTFPASITVTFSGFSNTAACTSCASYNTTYVINNSTTSPTCTYSRPTNPGPCSGSDAVTIALSLQGGQTRLVITNSINVDASPLHTVVIFQKDLGAGPIACSGYGTDTIPMSSTPFEVRCAHDGSSATVTL
jgi:hypothetical protein